MTETLFKTGIEGIGLPAAIFFIWYLYHKSQVEMFKGILDEQAQENKRNHEFLKGMMESNQVIMTLLTEINTKLSSNQNSIGIKEDFNKTQKIIKQ